MSLIAIFNVSAPGGIILQEGDNVCKTNTCLFGMADDMDKVKAFEQVFVKLMRRYVLKCERVMTIVNFMMKTTLLISNMRLRLQT